MPGEMTMPYKPKRPCAYPGCPKLTDGLFCTEHKKTENRNYTRYRRDPASNKRYGRAWKRIRDRYIAAHPLCEQCSAAGRYTPAQEVHHKKPLADGGTHAEDNLMALCKPCHSATTIASTNRQSMGEEKSQNVVQTGNAAGYRARNRSFKKGI
jgi:5-methylcytosine-specific restriction protein A